MLSFDRKFLNFLDKCASFLSKKGPFPQKPILSKPEEKVLALFLKILVEYRKDTGPNIFSRHFKRIRSFNLEVVQKYFDQDLIIPNSTCWLINFIFKYTIHDLYNVDTAVTKELYQTAYASSKSLSQNKKTQELKLTVRSNKLRQRKNLNKYEKNKICLITFSILFHCAIIVILGLTILDQFKNTPKEIKVNLIDNNQTQSKEKPSLKVQVPKVEDLKAALAVTESSKNTEHTLSDITFEVEQSFFKDFDDNTFSKKNLSLTFNKSFLGRSHKGKQRFLLKYGGTKDGQDALLKGLRYLKKVQNPDGSWDVINCESMTAFAILAFLAYGVTPQHEEFGMTVKKGLKWMLKIEQKSNNKQIRGSGYQHPIFTFAICEASSMMPQNTQVHQAMNRLVLTMLKGQCLNGGFPYFYGNQKPQLTLTGWNGLALKAALNSDCQLTRLYKAKDKLTAYLKRNFSELKNFHYPEESYKSLLAHKAIGTSLMQYFEGNSSIEVKQTLKSMKNISVRNFYEMYYTNICMFNEGGVLWPKWAKGFQKRLVVKQSRDGAWREVSWGGRSEWYVKKINWTMSTSIACIMLTVFYRYPRTGDKAKLIETDKKEEGLDLVIP